MTQSPRRRTMRTVGALPLAAGLLTAPVLFAAPALGDSHTGADTATVSVVHGVPGLTVDIYADNKEILSDVAPGTVSDALKLPAGTYDLEVFPDGEGPDGTAALSKDGVEVPAGANASVATHLDAAGNPMLSVFVNDTSAIPAGEARVTVRHAAAAPAVDVRAGGEVLFDNVTNGQQEAATVPAGTVSADVVLAGTDTVAIGPADLDLAEGSNTVVYAWGNSDAGYQLATQSINGMSSAPAGVDAGEGPAAPGMPAWILAGMGVAAMGAAAAGARVATRR